MKPPNDTVRRVYRLGVVAEASSGPVVELGGDGVEGA